MMKLIYTHSNATDHVLLVEDTPNGEFVRAAWEVCDDEFRQFCDCSQHPDNWETQGLNDAVEDYGEIVAERVGHQLHATDAAKWESRCAFFRI